MKKTKQVIGILLIIVALTALVYWEKDGRDRIMTVKVLVAHEDIMKGDIIKKQMLGVVSTMPETVVAGALKPEEISKALGKEAVQPIAKNQQISGTLFREPEEKTTERLSPYLIKSEWIDSRSSSLRRGDVIDIYSRDGDSYFGEFEIVFVKDSNDKEILDVNIDGTGTARQAGQGSEIRNRVSGSGVIDHIEILTELDEYRKIVQFIENKEDKLLIVQKGGA